MTDGERQGAAMAMFMIGAMGRQRAREDLRDSLRTLAADYGFNAVDLEEAIREALEEALDTSATVRLELGP